MKTPRTSTSMRKLVEAVTSTVRPPLTLTPAHGSYSDNARIAQNLKAMLHGEDAGLASNLAARIPRHDLLPHGANPRRQPGPSQALVRDY